MSPEIGPYLGDIIGKGDFRRLKKEQPEARRNIWSFVTLDNLLCRVTA